MDPNAKHSLADDLESFVHVLSWLALNFMPHELPPGDLTNLMQVFFDEAFPGPKGITKGGTVKRLSSRLIPSSGFRNERITRLLTKLTDCIAVRYEDEPVKERFRSQQSYDDAKDDYTERQTQLGTSDWMLEAFMNAVADRSAWPSDDRSKQNPLLHKPEQGLKRKSITDLASPASQRVRRE